MRIGRVINGYSNYLAILAIDAKLAPAYRGPGERVDEGKLDDDYNRTSDAIERKKWVHAVGDGTGILAEIGGCGAADVYRLGDTFVIPETYRGDDDADADAEHERVIAEHPTTSPKLLGSVEIPSGVLLLTGLLEKGPKLDLAKVKKAKVAKTPAGVAIAVPPGRYDVWREQFKKEVRGAWGSMPSRVRIVPAGKRLANKQAIMMLPPKPAPREATTSALRRLCDPKQKWVAISSLVIAPDGRAFAGENGGFGAAAWSADGKLLWQRDVAKAKKKEWSYELQVALVGNELLALPKYGATIYVLDPATGKQKKTIAIPPATRGFGVTPDAKRLVLRVSTETTIVAYPSGKQLAHFADYVNNSDVAISRDGKWLAVNGFEVHVFDLAKGKRTATIKPADDAPAIAWTHDGKLAVADGKARVGLYDAKGKRSALLDAAADRARKPAINGLATSKTHLAVSRDDGVVTLFELAKKTAVARYEKHAVAIPGTGATSLDGVAFSADGQTLWVSAGVKGEPVGLTGYFITEKRPEMPTPASTSKLNQRANVAVSAKYR